jgi:hypothetical protein
MELELGYICYARRSPAGWAPSGAKEAEGAGGEGPSLAGSAVVLMDSEPRESVKEVEEGSHPISRHGKLDGLLAT